jgi:hypothetical protein
MRVRIGRGGGGESGNWCTLSTLPHPRSTAIGATGGGDESDARHREHLPYVVVLLCRLLSSRLLLPLLLAILRLRRLASSEDSKLSTSRVAAPISPRMGQPGAGAGHAATCDAAMGNAEG